MGNAPYEITVSGTDDETFVFALPFESEDGSAFPFDEYTIEYAIRSGRGVSVLSLTQGDGITVASGVVTFQAERGRLRPGEYEHACRIRNVETSSETQVFDGKVIISEGGF